MIVTRFLMKSSLLLGVPGLLRGRGPDHLVLRRCAPDDGGAPDDVAVRVRGAGAPDDVVVASRAGAPDDVAVAGARAPDDVAVVGATRAPDDVAVVPGARAPH